MAFTYSKLAEVTVGAGGAASFSFTSIPSNYTDLCLKMSLRSERADYGDTVAMTFNGSTSGYSYRRIYGYGTGAGSDSGSGAYSVAGRIDADLNTASTFANVEIYIPNYAGSTQKSISIDSVYENNAAANAYAQAIAGLWANTTAITSIKFELDPTFLEYAQYSTATLYGVKAEV